MYDEEPYPEDGIEGRVKSFTQRSEISHSEVTFYVVDFLLEERMHRLRVKRRGKYLGG